MRSILISVTIFAFCVVAFAQETPITVQVIADFDKNARMTRLGELMGTWDRDANDETQSCKMSLAKDDSLGSEEGQSLRLEYDVDSPNPAFNGFFVKIGDAKIAPGQKLSFYVKGDPAKGFTKKIKIEIKDKQRGKGTFFIENITDSWRKISLEIDGRAFQEGKSKPLEEFVIVFDDVNSAPKTGAILIDQIEIS